MPKYAVIERCGGEHGPWYAFNDSPVGESLVNRTDSSSGVGSRLPVPEKSLVKLCWGFWIPYSFSVLLHLNSEYVLYNVMLDE